MFFGLRHSLLIRISSFDIRHSSSLNAAMRPSDAPAHSPRKATVLKRVLEKRVARAQCSLLSPASSMRTRLSRSEEHTSELQSQSNLVCRLLLEKKKISKI